MTKWNDYSQYKCECGKPSARGSVNSKRKDGTYPPRVSCLTGKPVCAKCFNDDIAKKNSKYDSYTQMQNSKTYRGKKYDIPYCQNKDGRLGFSCGMKEDYFDGSYDTIKVLEVDHIDGNPANCHDDNLMVLCPTCHKIKTWRNNDGASAGRKAKGISKPGIRTF